MTNIEDVPDLTINFQPNYHQTLLGNPALVFEGSR